MSPFPLGQAARVPAPLARLLSASAALVPAAALGNPPWEEARARILIARLSPWRDVSRSSSHLVLFSEARRALPGAYIDFAFLPDRSDRELIQAEERARGERMPWFFGAASREGPASFDLVLVSNAFGLELVNLSSLFATADLPMRASGRRGQENAPIVIIGGSNASALGPIVVAQGDASGPIVVAQGEASGPPAVARSDDSFVDGIFFGEGEGAVGSLAAILAERSRPKAARLEAALSIPGFWAAGMRGRGAHAGVATRRLPSSPPPLVDPPLLNSEESSTARLQISAGCPGLCSFCFEGWDRRPYRELPLAEVISAARELKRNTGADSLEVYSFNFNTHADIASLVFELGRIFRRVNLMSQRLDILARTKGLLAAELAADKRSFTLGVEGISARMRAYYRKGLSEEDLGRLEDLLLAPGVKELKLFYIVSGLEAEADLEEFSAFMEGLAARREASAKGIRILASAGYLVRLPRTPLQYAPLALDEGRLSGIAEAMGRACGKAGIEFRLAVHFDEYCADQLLSLGDGRLIAWLERAHAEGHIYDGSLSRGAWPSLEAHAAASGMLSPEFLAEKGEAWRPPLPFLETDGAVLRREYLAAAAFIDREPCLGGACSGCGACPDGDSIAAISGHRAAPPAPALIERITRLTAAKAAFKPLFVAADIPRELSGSTWAYKGAWLCRGIMAASREAAAARGSVDNSDLSLFEAREALFSPGDVLGLPEGFTGKTAFALYGPSRERLAELAALAGLESASALPRIARARLEVGLDLPPAEAIGAFRDWLSRGRAACTERKAGGSRLFEAAGKDARKAFVLSAEFSAGEDAEGCRANLVLGPKARLSDWLELMGRKGKAARVRVLDLGQPG